MIDVQIEVHGAKETSAWVDSLGRKLDRNMKVAMQESMGILKTNIIPFTPVGYPGSPNKLVESYASRIEGGGDELTGTFFSNAPEAKVASIELGRSPGSAMPPISAILPWVVWKFGGTMHDAVMVAQSIAHRGIKGRYMFEKTAIQSRPAIEGAFEKAVERSLG